MSSLYLLLTAVGGLRLCYLITMHNNVRHCRSFAEMSKNSTTSTVICIPTEIYEKIEFQASTEDKTVSAIINHILRKYVSWDQFVSDIGFVFLQKPFGTKYLRTCFRRRYRESSQDFLLYRNEGCDFLYSRKK